MKFASNEFELLYSFSPEYWETSMFGIVTRKPYDELNEPEHEIMVLFVPR